MWDKTEMKKFNKIFVLGAFLAVTMSYAQEFKDWEKMTPEKRREIIGKMKPEERADLLKKFRGNMLVEDLSIPNERKEEFQGLYSEYQDSQKRIKSQFVPKENYDTMSDEEARRELENSFMVSQQLLDDRKNYSQKFQRVMKPQKVLEMFQTEGMMRNKVMDRQRELHVPAGTSPYRNNNGSAGARSQGRRP